MRRLTRHVSVTAHKDDESQAQFSEESRLMKKPNYSHSCSFTLYYRSSFRSVSVQATGEVRPAVDTAHFTHTLGLYIAVMGVRTWGKWGQLTPPGKMDEKLKSEMFIF